MSEDPQTTMADWFRNKINSKGTSIRKGWGGSGSFPSTECYPSPGQGHFLRAAPLLSRQLPALRLGDILHISSWSGFTSLPKSPWVHTDMAFCEWGGNKAFLWFEQKSSQSWRFRWCLRLSITHSVSWGWGKKKLLQGYKCFKAWSSVSNVKFKACWGRPDDVIGGKLQRCFKISLWFSSISQTFINCSCKFWKCWKSHASSPLQDCKVLIGAFLCAHSKKIHPTFPLLPSWRRKKHSFDKQKQDWRAWGRVSEKHKDEKDKRNLKGEVLYWRWWQKGGEKKFLEKKNENIR